jgi:hypothetical protein
MEVYVDAKCVFNRHWLAEYWFRSLRVNTISYTNHKSKLTVLTLVLETEQFSEHWFNLHLDAAERPRELYSSYYP